MGALAEQRAVRRAGRERRRGGRRAPVAVQRAAQRLDAGVRHARSVVTRVVEGDRPLIAGLLGLLALSVVMLSGPLQSFWDGRSRVELLETKNAALEAEIAALEQRREDLLDPAAIELRAREELGFSRPGDVTYQIVPPEVDRPVITAPRDVEPGPAPWYRRLWTSLAELVG